MNIFSDLTAPKHTIEGSRYTSTFDEEGIEALRESGLAKYLEHPDMAASMPSTLDGNHLEHVPWFREGRIYRIGPEVGGLAVKPTRNSSTLKQTLSQHATQDFLHAALSDVDGYAGARVHASIRPINEGTGYTIGEYVHARDLSHVEGNINYRNPFRYWTTRPLMAIKQRAVRREFLPEGTSMKEYWDLRDNASNVVSEVASYYNFADEYSSWDLNPTNLLLTATDEGYAQLTLIDQAAEFTDEGLGVRLRPSIQ